MPHHFIILITVVNRCEIVYTEVAKTNGLSRMPDPAKGSI
jgi:hypothetical protein